uniref:Uncharacterized protein n=1 Tax=Gibberella zeae (strain ATCC MYA-4620 / CBS 123657 / FGSC 9075 / NRRL 31084 / PH-1) TaxID=229533 RepID=A0A098DRS3_GIBZE
MEMLKRRRASEKPGRDIDICQDNSPDKKSLRTSCLNRAAHGKDKRALPAYLKRFHVSSNHGSGSNGRTPSDADPRQDQGARTDPAIVLNTDGVGEGRAAGFPPDLRIECVGDGADTNVRADQHPVANKDGGVIVN